MKNPPHISRPESRPESCPKSSTPPRARPLAGSGGHKPWDPERAGSTYSLLVHSHLRWDWVWQRPQQFLSRLAVHAPVLFVEEPIAGDGPAGRISARAVAGSGQVTVVTTELPRGLMESR